MSSVSKEPDGSFIYTGKCWIGKDYPILKKISPEGTEVWTQLYYNFSPNYGSLSTLFDKTLDGGFILCGNNQSYPGYTDYDLHLIWTDSAGNFQRDTLLADSAITTGVNILTMNNGHFTIVGSCEIPNNESNIFLLQVDSEGNILWLKEYGGTNTDQASGACLTSDSSFVIVGTTQSFGNGSNDIYIIKTNMLGDTIWTKVYGGQNDDYGTSIHSVENGGYIVTGYTNSYGSGNYDGYVLRINENDDRLWTKIVGGENDDRIYDAVSSEYGFITVGFTESLLPPNYSNRDVYVNLIDNGFTLSSFTFQFGTSPNPHLTYQKNSASRIQKISESEFLIGGDYLTKSSYNEYFRDAGLAKVRLGTSSVWINNEFSNTFHLYQNYPNPFNPITGIKYSVPKTSKISLVVYDILGREITTLVNEEKLSGNYTVEFNGANLASGVYFYIMRADNFIDTKKFILLK